MQLAQVLERIPYLRPHSLAVSQDDRQVRVEMPLRPELTNHVGILHAGALYTAAETAAGVAAWGVVGGDRAFVLLRESTVRFTRRAETEVVATASVDPEAAAAALATFDESGRADVVAEVVVADRDGEVVFRGSFDYALRPRR